MLVQKLESKAERSGLQIPNLNDDKRGSIVVNEQEQNQNRRIPGKEKTNFKFCKFQKEPNTLTASIKIYKDLTLKDNQLNSLA